MIEYRVTTEGKPEVVITSDPLAIALKSVDDESPLFHCVRATIVIGGNMDIDMLYIHEMKIVPWLYDTFNGAILITQDDPIAKSDNEILESIGFVSIAEASFDYLEELVKTILTKRASTNENLEVKSVMFEIV